MYQQYHENYLELYVASLTKCNGTSHEDHRFNGRVIKILSGSRNVSHRNEQELNDIANEMEKVRIGSFNL